MTDLKPVLAAVDRALAECDASTLPPVGLTCLRRSCTNSVTPWLNPYYCSESCREQANTVSPDHETSSEWIAVGQWGSVGFTRQEDLPAPDDPVVLGLSVEQAVAGAGALANVGLSIGDHLDQAPSTHSTELTRGRLSRWIRRRS